MVVLSLVVKPIYVSKAREDFSIDVRKMLDSLSDTVEGLDAVVMKTKSKFLLSLGDLDQEKGVLLVFESVLAFFQELDGVFDALELSAAGYGDEGVLQWVESVVQVLDDLLVESDQLISIAGCVETLVLHILHQAVCQLMPHLGRIVGFDLGDKILESREFYVVLIEKCVELCGWDSRHFRCLKIKII